MAWAVVLGSGGLRGSPEAVVTVWLGLQSCTPDRGWRIGFHGGSLPQLTYLCRLLAGGLISYLCGPLHRLPGFPHEMASDFPHRERTKRARWKVQDLVWASLWRHTPTHTQTFCWSHRQSRFNKGGATQRHGSQEVRMVEGHLDDAFETATPMKRWSLSLHSLILVWPWNLLWPIETGGNDAVRVLSQATRFPFAAPTLLECCCHESILDSPPWGWENRKREGLVPDILAEASDTRVSPASGTYGKDRLFLLSPTQTLEWFTMQP